LKNWLGCEKRGLTLLPEDCPKNDTFLLPSFSIFFYLTFNDNGLVDHVLEVDVVGVEQLELNVIIQPIQEHVLFLLIRADIVRGIP
jgi:hypothetical protein